jgi:hypothetical protein
MYVFRHHHITGDVAAVPTSDSLEFSFEGLTRSHRVQERDSPVTTERDEVQASLLLVAFGFRSHGKGILIPNDIPPSRKNREKDGATPKLGIQSERLGQPPVG